MNATGMLAAPAKAHFGVTASSSPGGTGPDLSQVGNSGLVIMPGVTPIPATMVLNAVWDNDYSDPVMNQQVKYINNYPGGLPQHTTLYFIHGGKFWRTITATGVAAANSYPFTAQYSSPGAPTDSAAIAAAATKKMAPPASSVSTTKILGYTAAAGVLGVGAWWYFFKRAATRNPVPKFAVGETVHNEHSNVIGEVKAVEYMKVSHFYLVQLPDGRSAWMNEKNLQKWHAKQHRRMRAAKRRR